MKCPFCSSENTRVIDSRPADDNNSIRRRRLCDDCGKRFTTYEKVETIPLIVIKKDNTREQYDRSISGQSLSIRSTSLWMKWRRRSLTARRRRFRVP